MTATKSEKNLKTTRQPRVSRIKISGDPMSAKRLCAALNCTHKVQRKFLMCYFHWAALPNAIREAVCMAYVSGQESGRKPIKPEWVRASRDAIIYIADKEGVEFLDDYGKPIENTEQAPPPDQNQDLD